MRSLLFICAATASAAALGVLVGGIHSGTPIARYRNSSYTVLVAEIFEGVDGCTGDQGT